MPTCLLLPQCSLLLPPSVLFWVEAQPLLALFFIIALSAPLESSLPLSLSLERSLRKGKEQVLFVATWPECRTA